MYLYPISSSWLDDFLSLSRYDNIMTLLCYIFSTALHCSYVECESVFKLTKDIPYLAL